MNYGETLIKKHNKYAGRIFKNIYELKREID